MFTRLSIKLKVTVLISCALVGLMVYAWHAQATVQKVRINGPVYQEIIQGKDLLADILPPPEYLVESYLLAFQMIGVQDRTHLLSLVERGRKLAEEFEARYAYWAKALPDGQAKTLLTERAYAPGRAFLTVFTNELVPALMAATGRKPA